MPSTWGCTTRLMTWPSCWPTRVLPSPLIPAILTEAETAALDEGEAEGAAEETAVEEETAAEEETEETPDEELFQRLIQSELGSVQMSGTALILLDEGANGRSLVVLAASQEGLENTISRLLDLIPLDADYALADCLLQDNLALCPTNVSDEAVEAELLTGGDLAAEEEDDEDEADEEEEPIVDNEEEEDDEPIGEEIDATDQGSIGLGDTVEGTLPEGESFSWTFSDGPAVIDIVLESGEDMDAVLRLFDANNNLIASADSGFTGDAETIVAADIPDDAEYTIVVKDFYDDGGEFVLTVSESSEAPADDDDDDEEGDSGSSEDVTVFLFIDDDGDPIGDGFTSQAELEALLADYTVETWVTTEDGPLTSDALETADLLIWDSGDYLNPDGFLDEDTFIVYDYIESGRPLLVMGSSPTIFGDIGLSDLSDVEFFGEDEVLLEGFEAGDVLTLDDTYEVVFADFLVEDLEPGSVAFLLQGPTSADAGNIIGLAAIDDINNDQRSVFLLMPFSVLPEDVQAQLLSNMLAWLGFSVP
jgi:hypothetical protein